MTGVNRRIRRDPDDVRRLPVACWFDRSQGRHFSPFWHNQSNGVMRSMACRHRHMPGLCDVELCQVHVDPHSYDLAIFEAIDRGEVGICGSADGFDVKKVSNLA